ncbi:phenylalanine--tRNA ligase subunit beta [Tsukamurella ocularis]|uniref:phenylalanine--tRNA ligase subunit beta n=1 Tax=Tsukamurella ocularis TaxID=1970234 RepID=UPI0021695F7E|nr:phenylalanine--tRNA ligase subunit beta [Tsukamurella ocularis]MCS3782380.1 phenylalanyl-tRNA synthetase beta chain [Tsukamurella ocularis]MCS3789785.1 phenylalanyl-tRNA synthetase beta chain [Tsukamurella ocularis]MCS3853170.1 phenylalanyl-tRNA synthetase beta chain [Tsukamurella ocularis]
MRVAQSWLTEILRRDTPDWGVTADELDAGFVRVGFEVEELDSLDTVTGPLKIGRVVAIEELTNFRKPIRFCQVDVGEAEPRDIVCGARNFAEGDLIVAALPGAVLPGGFAIATRQTYDHTSDGMICSVSELGLGTDHSGILVLPAGTAAPGDDAKQVLGMDDTVIELNVTPDRGYAFSVRGLARELACGYDLPFTDITTPSEKAGRGAGGVDVTVEPESGCTRFTALRVEGIDPKAVSPWWLQRRLLTSGVRPISAAVDVTNYLMLLSGQPLHAFDADKVRGGLVVRASRLGETLETLDHVERKLDPEDAVIVDDSGPVSLAGVMGGATTEVGDDTVNVILEGAIWNPVKVFRTGKRHKLSSDAAKRYERTVDPAISVWTVREAARLLTEIAGGTVVGELTDLGGYADRPQVTIAADRPDRVAGITYAPGTTVRRLTQIGCEVEGEGSLTVTPPTWRPDLNMVADLVEEVLRLEGLEQIPPVLPAAPGGRGLSARQRRRRTVSRSLAHTGHVEVLTSPFLPAGVFDTWGLEADDPRRNTTKVLNPLESDRPSLATTLLPGLLEILARNVSRGQRDLALYTIAQVVLPSEKTVAVDPIPVDRRPTAEQVAELDASLPSQPEHIALVFTGQRVLAGPAGPGRAADAADAFEAVREIGRASNVELTLRSAQFAPFHPGRCAEVLVGETVVGHAGELHPAVLERAGLPERTTAVELDLDAIPLVENLPAPVISPFPAVLQDVAVVVDAAVPAEAVRAALADGAGELLEAISLFDVFTGAQVGEGRKSMAFSLRFRAGDRTLTEDEASTARDAAVAKASELVGAVLR